MAKVGRFVSDPKAGAYCQVTLDSGEKIVVNHDKGGFKGGRVAIEVSKYMGFRPPGLSSPEPSSESVAARRQGIEFVRSDPPCVRLQVGSRGILLSGPLG
jgi:hypothetical protein